ncbi:hypothetical protein BCR32DRAFT_250055 [Anaeromyces robustus]|jgi:putative effector of murein hydrolase/putative effector of murein hydrolase LrgA (UPF0299 family)|uniref:LrgB-domain-containing protein n=1 Tax=Anaeromyces robustus TaxID=1754192 RepID=A0A1Y1WGK4_9FUNG|nr:hypothetical protein BCR32DRAFT_250055 [Anaeromyces robustus]|eukprot:ORX72525.1 hypothetical protein BCR32DRAFT_250055 [Anaeromyces robustus]
MGNSNKKEQSLTQKLINDWIYVPIGIAIIIAIIIGVNQLLRAIGFNFPANVAAMLIVGALLITAEYTLPKNVMSKILKCIDPAIGFLMKWMIIFFVPPLITILNSDNLPTGGDIIKLIIVFFVGLIIFIPLVAYVVHYASVLFERVKKGKSYKNKNEIKEKEMKEMEEKNKNYMVEIVTDDEEKTMDITIYDENRSHTSEETYENTVMDTSSHSPKDIDVIAKSKENVDVNNKNSFKNNNNNNNENKKRKFNWKSSATPSKYNFITYIIIYALSWIPAAIWNVTQPLHIAVNVLSYLIGLCVPDKIRVIFHPLISCTVFSYLFYWIEGLAFGRSLKEELALYSNNSKFLLYLNDTSLPFPKAGEMLFCILDATVVALSFRILEHHKLIFRHIFELVGSIVIMSFLSMLVHTFLCRIIGIAPIYSLSMASRSVTSPLAIQVVNFLNSDMAIAIVIVAFTGVFTDILGLPILKLIHFPLSDSLAHGACMGCAGHAVATASLIKDFPSASAVSSISFVLFSTMCVIWSAIPPIANLFHSIAGF